MKVYLLSYCAFHEAPDVEGVLYNAAPFATMKEAKKEAQQIADDIREVLNDNEDNPSPLVKPKWEQIDAHGSEEKNWTTQAHEHEFVIREWEV